jgi:hypothetical protein
MGSIEGRQPVQLSFLCPCGKRIALKALGCCRSCYDRRHHSLRFFGGLRERVLERDRFRCRGCGRRSELVVHHRDRHNQADLLVTLCIRCHIRIHHASGLKYWFSKTLVRLWRELHPSAPMQLQLTFRNAEKKENSKGFLEKVSVKVLPLLVLADAHTSRLIGALAEPEESTSPDTTTGERLAMEPFTKALEIVARVMRDGAATHPDNDWVRRSPEYHLGRAEEHLRLWRDGDQLQDHVSHAATRLLMALTLRELG